MSSRAKRILKEWIIPFGLEALGLWLLFTYLINITVVPTGSMLPTISEGSVVICTRVYNPEKLERGDIVAFESDELDKRLIKRLIGLPGDTVYIDESGALFLNGEEQEETYVVYQLTGYTFSFEVPEGKYLFMGDNRAGSNDARLWDESYIPAEDIVCKAHFSIWPLNNFGKLR